ncbi:G patch domain-containing protein 11 [Frankliniella fusca]|uniref:G patch domain-containing protein 11 n=1 Tax=Frankliniella fusca TaxID=407009 RepID=A0AAE1HE20_9NEOP|nr:G patch domain-containing protein 11 [Frankliniella fusca]
MSSDEDDYMSAAFIVESPAKDVRPGLLHNRNQQRSHEIYKKKQVRDAETREQQRPVKVIEAQRREEGLQVAIGADNKGFALLQKMGYKPGTGIGKSGTGSVDPIPLHLKTDRKGLGRAAAIEEIKESKRLFRAKRQESSKSGEVSVEQFRARMRQKSDQRLTEIDLFKSQKACHQLDTEGGFTEPAESWFWPRLKKPEKKPGDGFGEDQAEVPPSGAQDSAPTTCHEDSDDEEDDEFEASEKLEMLTKYLRCTYNYCTWCCVKFDDEKDMQSECPGPTRDDH